MSNEIPQSIGKYKVTDIIAKGGMGVVYKAIHPSLKRYVVIKKMSSRGNASNAERFKKEAQILLDLQSPYIVHLFDYFTEGSYRYMVEELVDGIAVDRLIQKQTVLPPPIAMLILQDACFALKYAHSKDIVHRDIKPGNILISRRGEIKLADFGIASENAGAKEDENLTKSGVTLGTPAYMPPEQFENTAGVDNRADIYALGIMLYEMLTGTKPYPGTFTMETLKVIKKGKYIHTRKIDKTIPFELERLIHRMIRPNRNRRFKSIDGVLRCVKKYLRHFDTHELRVQLAKAVISTKTYNFPRMIQRDKRRRFIAKICAAAIVLGMICGILFKAGFFHKTLLRKIYSPVKVEMEMPKSLADTFDLPIKAFFFIDDGLDLPEIESARTTFQAKGTQRLENIVNFEPVITVDRMSAKSKVYDISTVYLKDGDYRVKIVAGPYVVWQSFSVKGEKVLLNCDLLKNITREMKITATVTDAESGADITSKSEINVLYKSKWVPLNSVNPEDIKSGTVWKFKVSSEGYETADYSLLIDWYQDRLYLIAQLKKKN